MIPERIGLIVWVHHFKALKRLERFGTVHYVSRKMKYVVMYINKDQEQKVIEQLKRWNFVKEIDKSYRNELKTEYNKINEDKTTFYTL